MRNFLPLIGCALLLASGQATVAAASRTGRLPQTFLPSAISFWSARSGIMAGVASATNTVYLAATSDAGRTWQVRLRIAQGARYVAAVFVDTSYHGRGWLTVETCVRKGGFPYGNCAIQAMQTDDGGRDWSFGGPRSVSFAVVGGQGFALVAHGPGLMQTRLYRLTTAAGGRGLRLARVSAPCLGDARGAAPSLAAVASLGGARALLVCAGAQRTLASAVTVQAKYFFATSDGGRTWHAVLSVPARAAAPGLGVGAVQGVTFLPGGRGWLWSFRGGLYATRDGGRTWTRGRLVTELEVEEPLSVSFVDDRTGYALLQGTPKGPYVSLMRTEDGGAAWTEIGGWTPPRLDAPGGGG